MQILQATLMGFIQGLSEFLPISSSGHLVLTSNFYKIYNNIDITVRSGQEVFFDIMLHLGTLIAVLIFFRKDILNIIKGFYYGLKNKDYMNHDFRMGIYIIAGTIATVLLAVPLSNTAEMLVFMPAGVGLFLVITGWLLLFSEWISKKYADKKEISIKSAILIGLAQGLASLPGFSRSGFTIAAGLLSGSDRTTAARYSFLLLIPVILGASMIYPLVNIDLKELVTYNWPAIIIGTIVSGITGYFCIKYFIKFIENFSLKIFGYYCVIVGIAAYMFFIGRV